MVGRKSELELVLDILHQLKGHPNFVIANRIVDELTRFNEQRMSEGPKLVPKRV
jgi:hypothetical protein